MSPFSTLKSFYTAQESIDKMKKQSTEWENIFANDTSDKGLMLKIYKELIELNIKTNKQTIQLKMGKGPE